MGRYRIDRDTLEDLYGAFNRRQFVHPDPVEFLYEYEDPADREVAAIVASSLAYGRVTQILSSVSTVLEKMGRSPYDFVMSVEPGALVRAFSDFKHRFTTGRELSVMLSGVKVALERYGTLNDCFRTGLRRTDETVIPALSAFVAELAGGPVSCGYLMPSPAGGSACKRLNLFLRWMVRRDEVDPGGWTGVPASKLVVPLDTHMHRICVELGFTERKQANMRAALEITEAFRRFAPDDPVRYDFALTRLGIRGDASLGDFLKRVDAEQGKASREVIDIDR